MNDSISRQEAMNILTSMSTNHFYGHRTMEAFRLGAEALSVGQQGRWIPQEYMSEIDSFLYTEYKCSNCGEISKKKSNYCPNCGSLMMNEEE